MARVNPSSAPVLASGPEAALAVSEPERETYVPVSLLADAKLRAGLREAEAFLTSWLKLKAATPVNAFPHLGKKIVDLYRCKCGNEWEEEAPVECPEVQVLHVLVTAAERMPDRERQGAHRRQQPSARHLPPATSTGYRRGGLQSSAGGLALHSGVGPRRSLRGDC
jgi:hypothetical protein